jgi:hypothetical protein
MLIAGFMWQSLVILSAPGIFLSTVGAIIMATVVDGKYK